MEKKTEHKMRFDALRVAVEFVAAVGPVVAQVRRRDRSLADQLARAAQSTALNLAEGRRRVGKDRAHFFRIAGGSNDEARTALQIAEAWGYVVHDRVVAELSDRLAAMTWRLAG